MTTYLSGGTSGDWSVLELPTTWATGSTVVWPAQYNSIFFTSNSTTAAQTINLPLTPGNGDILTISNLGAITALTMAPAVAGGFSALTYGQGMQVRYSTTLPGWHVFS
jgi:hypothetical protein